MSISPTPQQLQALVLETLGSRPEGIEDSRGLVWEGKTFDSSEEQSGIRAVLDSLASKNVSSLLSAYMSISPSLSIFR